MTWQCKDSAAFNQKILTNLESHGYDSINKFDYVL